jgi:hypothetical protein
VEAVGIAAAAAAADEPVHGALANVAIADEMVDGGIFGGEVLVDGVLVDELLEDGVLVDGLFVAGVLLDEAVDDLAFHDATNKCADIAAVVAAAAEADMDLKADIDGN